MRCFGAQEHTMSTRLILLHDAQRVIDAAKTAHRPMTDIERASVRAKIDEAARLDAKQHDDEDDEIRRGLSRALRDDYSPGETGRFSAKAATTAIVEQIRPETQGDLAVGCRRCGSRLDDR
jgi:hypothetical protein